MPGDAADRWGADMRWWTRAAVGLALLVLLGVPALAGAREDAVAVIIGNKDYAEGIPDVSFAGNDADAMKHFVVEVLGYDSENIIDLRDATAAEMNDVFGNERGHKGKLWSYLDPAGGSEVTVFYSGHGVPGLDGKSYLLPVDAAPDRPEINGYPLAVLYANLLKLKTRGVTIYLDACFSGGSGDGGMVVGNTSGILVAPRAVKADGLTILTAAGGREVASWDEDARHGLFTRHLLDALRGAADAPRYGEKDGKVTLGEAKAYLDRHMTRAARRTYLRDQNTHAEGDATRVLALLPKGQPVPKAQGHSQATPVVGTYSLRPGETFRDCADCPEMVVVPSGSFMMGSPESEEGRDDDEGPRHRVTIPAPFAVGRFAVTFSEWDACVSDGGCGGYRPKDRDWGRDRRPVIYVSWNDAKRYVSWLSQKTGRGYRLLSEAEWEYVARAGTTTRYHWGDDYRSDRVADGDQTEPVGRYASNRFGLHDVHGNVLEWVEDCRNGSYAGAPDDGRAWVSGDCDYRVVRGGSWSDNPRDLRAANRDRSRAERRGLNIGFRVVRTL